MSHHSYGNKAKKRKVESGKKQQRECSEAGDHPMQCIHGHHYYTVTQMSLIDTECVELVSSSPTTVSNI
jgi:hypothetical protein